MASIFVGIRANLAHDRRVTVERDGRECALLSTVSHFMSLIHLRARIVPSTRSDDAPGQLIHQRPPGTIPIADADVDRGRAHLDLLPHAATEQRVGDALIGSSTSGPSVRFWAATPLGAEAWHRNDGVRLRYPAHGQRLRRWLTSDVNPGPQLGGQACRAGRPPPIPLR